MKRAIDAADREKIVAAYKTREWSLRALAGMFDMSPEGVRKLLKAEGVAINPPHKRLQ